jgi:hypothetical protein
MRHGNGGDLMGRFRITDIRFVPSSVTKRETGLFGWASCGILDGDLILNSIAVRRDRRGKLLISFPSRRDGNNIEQAYFLTRNPALRCEIEEAILRHVQEEGLV